MQEAIKSGTGHDGIAGKDVSPFREGFVGGDNDGGVFLISVADDLEEQGSSGGIQAEVADFIDDEQLGLSKHFHGMREPILGEGSSQTAGQLHGAEEEETVAEFGRQDVPRHAFPWERDGCNGALIRGDWQVGHGEICQ